MQPPEDTRPPDSRRGFLTGTALGAAGGLAGGLGAAALRDRNSEAVPATPAPTANPRLFTFVGGTAGPWSVVSIAAVAGESLPAAERLDVVSSNVPHAPDGAAWVLRGATSNERYTTRAEKDRLVAAQAALGRPEATRAALIPIRKSAAWWALTQDERRALFEEQSKHVRVGLKYLPAVARRLHHCRDLATAEPFDFVTFFDYAPADAQAFEEMTAALRATAEWKYVEREVDVRLERTA